MKNSAFAVGTTPVLLAKGPCNCYIFPSGPLYVGGDTNVNNVNGINAGAPTFPVLKLLPGEKVYGISDTSADVRVLEFGLP